MVLVKNRCVGILHYLFMGMIMAYIVGYVFVTEKKYLELDEPVAITTWATMGPCAPKDKTGLCTVANSTNPVASVDELECKREFQCNRHSYCLPDGSSEILDNYTVGGRMPCRWLDHNEVSWPPNEREALTIATRTSLYKQTLKYPNGTGCAPGPAAQNTAWDCAYHPSVASGDSLDAYVADIGNFTVNFAHVVSATFLPITATGMQMNGALLRCKEGKHCEDADSRVEVKSFLPTKANQGHATFTVDEIMKHIVPPHGRGVAEGQYGINLDDKSNACPEKCRSVSTGEYIEATNRWTGFDIIAEVTYDNTGLYIKESSPHKSPMYTVLFKAVDKSVYNVEVPFIQKGSERVVQRLAGPRITVSIKGTLGRFSWMTIMVQLSQSILLIFLSSTMVDMVLMRFMVNSEYFNYLKYESDDERLRRLIESIEHSDIPEAKKKSRIATVSAMGGAEGSEIDWKKIYTLGMYSDAVDTEQDMHMWVTDETTPLTGRGKKPLL